MAKGLGAAGVRLLMASHISQSRIKVATDTLYLIFAAAAATGFAYIGQNLLKLTGGIYDISDPRRECQEEFRINVRACAVGLHVCA